MAAATHRTGMIRIESHCTQPSTDALRSHSDIGQNSQLFDKLLTIRQVGRTNLALTPVAMKPRLVMTAPTRTVREIAAEMDQLFQRQIELMKSETFVGLTPSERAEYERIGERIRELFGELARFK